ncbi:MAG: hypothetical protein CMJ83_03915 [Planctomycetes bacterium]|nr:hypothetical protein [Planctomycetota bacterium]
MAAVFASPTWAQRGTKGPEVGKPAPGIAGIDLDGKKFELSDCRGKVILLDFCGQGSRGRQERREGDTQEGQVRQLGP